jgi:MFS transporter, FHS family, L-fucose permease
MSTSTSHNFAAKHPQYVSFFVLLSFTFFMWGFLTCNNTILIPHVMNIFQLNFVQAQMLNFSFFSTYLIMAVPMGKLVNKIGYKNSIIVGLIVAGYSCTLFGPACTIHSYNLFLLAMVVMASGITLLQVAANPYILLLSYHNTAASRLTLKQGFNSLGSTMAPFLGSVLFYFTNFTEEQMMVMNPADYRIAEAEIVQIPYMGLATVLFLTAFAMFFSKIPDIQTHSEEPKVARDKNRLKYVLQFPHLYLGMIAMFLYVGAEVGIGTFLVNVMTNSQFGDIDFYDAPKYVLFYWAGSMAGRFLGHFVLPKFETGKAVALMAIISSVLVLSFMYASGTFAVTLLILVGLSNSIIFPCIFTLGIDGLGKFSEEGSSMLILGVFGGAVIPLLMGSMIGYVGLQKVFFIPVLCYVYIIYYGLVGSKINK